MITTTRKKDIPISIVQGHLKRRFFRNNGAASGSAFRFSEKERVAIAAAAAMVLSPDKNFP